MKVIDWLRANDWALLALRLVAGGVLAFSGVMKAAAPAEEFAAIIEGYYMVQSHDTIMQLARLLPWLEALGGFALIYGVFTRAAAAACGGLYLVFIVAISSALSRKVPLENCGCFGFGFHMDPQMTRLMDLGLLALCAVIAAAGSTRLSLDNWASRGYTRKA